MKHPMFNLEISDAPPKPEKQCNYSQDGFGDSLMTFNRMKDNEMAILPWIFYRTESGLGYAPIQYDADGVDGHTQISQDNFQKAKTIKVVNNGTNTIVYLAKAHYESSFVRVEMPFANGILWGWFPKELAA